MQDEVEENKGSETEVVGPSWHWVAKKSKLIFTFEYSQPWKLNWKVTGKRTKTQVITQRIQKKYC